jgi:protein arginine kinase activator
VGKSPVKTAKPIKVKSELTDLKRKLDRAIEQEAFEDAARLRDQIRRLEQGEGTPPAKPKGRAQPPGA